MITTTTFVTKSGTLFWALLLSSADVSFRKWLQLLKQQKLNWLVFKTTYCSCLNFSILGTLIHMMNHHMEVKILFWEFQNNSLKHFAAYMEKFRNSRLVHLAKFFLSYIPYIQQCIYVKPISLFFYFISGEYRVLTCCKYFL